jgi:hypothetical protein
MPALDNIEKPRRQATCARDVVPVPELPIFERRAMSPTISERNAMFGNLVRVVATCTLVLAAVPDAQAQSAIDPVSVPSNLEVPAGYTAYLKVHASGTQNYMCLPWSTTPVVGWKLVGPQATLFEIGAGLLTQQVATHFLSVNPAEGVARPTWQHSLDSSRVWGRALQSSTDPGYVEAGAIPWLLLAATGVQEGPEGGTLLTRTAFVQRVNTSGGAAPSTGCARPTDIGALALVPYSADYVFFKPSGQ